MSAAKGKENKKGSDRKEEFFHSRNVFIDRPDEEKICGRALKTLMYLCPEVAWLSENNGDAAANPEGIN